MCCNVENISPLTLSKYLVSPRNLLPAILNFSQVIMYLKNDFYSCLLQLCIIFIHNYNKITFLTISHHKPTQSHIHQGVANGLSKN